MNHLDDILPDLLLGTLSPEGQRTAEQHLSTCELCRAEVARLSASLDRLASLAVPTDPPPGVLDRIVGEMEGPGRFHRFVKEIAAFFDLSEAQAQRVLSDLDTPTSWVPGPTQGIQMMPVEAGPAKAGMLAAFVRMRPGARFPLHTHLGREWNFVLEGGIQAGSGREFWPGETLEMGEGSSHTFTALAGPACTAATLLDGVASFDEELGPPG
ncbi:cupin domain-containing protein [Stigmatella sp. ncwal1]|uniref:Cupin domain-containing protein n=1 Tax=Stigmatella ashevillensis TaxID=2995309 RepID=A0ABT5DH43_9BACT|nr:cupin domain-containing protein [Stigmatella ashevillena]MDC0712909.1 cupin domain-containing protein [Stigmatella ashevillena]